MQKVSAFHSLHLLLPGKLQKHATGEVLAHDSRPHAQPTASSKLTVATLHKVIEGVSVTSVCELAVVGRALLQALDSDSAEVSSV